MSYKKVTGVTLELLFYATCSCYSKCAAGQSPAKLIVQEATNMALANIAGWNATENQQSGAACGTACGAAEKPAACGTACGAADKPAACGTACGASDK